MAKWTKIIVANILVLVVIIGVAAIGGFYIYENSQYITTDDAKVSANMISVTALVSGKIVAWHVRPGDQVSDNSALGEEQAAGGATSAAGSQPAISAELAQAPGQTGTTPRTGTTSRTGAAAAPSAGGGTAGQAAHPATTAPVGPTKVAVNAPITGTIIQTMVEQGQTVMPGQVLAMMADLKNLFVVANIEESRIKDVRPGQTVDVTLDAFPGQTFDGRVQAIIHATSSTFSLIPTGNTEGSYTKVIQKIPVQISINTEDKEVFPGMSASVKIHK